MNYWYSFTRRSLRRLSIFLTFCLSFCLSVRNFTKQLYWLDLHEDLMIDVSLVKEVAIKLCNSSDLEFRFLLADVCTLRLLFCKFIITKKVNNGWKEKRLAFRFCIEKVCFCCWLLSYVLYAAAILMTHFWPPTVSASPCLGLVR